MRRVAISLLLTCLLVACGAAPADPGGSALPTSAGIPLEYLLASAAGDFHRTQPPYPAAFRDVHLRSVEATGGTAQFMLCGAFLPAGDDTGDDWVSFVTIQTSGYEQMLGAQATALCEKGAPVPPAQDLSADLHARLQALR